MKFRCYVSTVADIPTAFDFEAESKEEALKLGEQVPGAKRVSCFAPSQTSRVRDLLADRMSGFPLVGSHLAVKS